MGFTDSIKEGKVQMLDFFESRRPSEMKNPGKP